MTMNVSLTSQLEQYVEEKVKSGLYFTASEVIRDGLRLLREQDETRGRKVKALQDKIDRGIAQLDRGEGIPGPAARAEMKRYSAEQSKRRG
jgi:antitoxin ParD1/3/4